MVYDSLDLRKLQQSISELGEKLSKIQILGKDGENGEDGLDADPKYIQELVDEAIAAVRADALRIVNTASEEAVRTASRAIAAIPDLVGDSAVGLDAVKAMVAAAVAVLPPRVDGEDGKPGAGLPPGGTTGQIPVKASDEDYDFEYRDLPAANGGAQMFGIGTLPAGPAVKDEGTVITSRVTSLNFVGTGVAVTGSGDDVTVTVTAGGTSYTDEEARDAIGTALAEGTAIDITVNDAGDTITIAVDKSETSLAGFAATTSAELAAVISDETGSGALVFAGGNIGAATGTSLALGGATIGSDALGVTGTTTLNGTTVSGAGLTLSGNISGAGIFGIAGARIKGGAATITDTTASGTIATAYAHVQGAITFAASGAATITNAFGAYFVDPVAGTGPVTLTNKWALGADSLKIGTVSFVTINTLGDLTAKSFNITGSSSLNSFGDILASNSRSLGWTGSALHFKVTGTEVVILNNSSESKLVPLQTLATNNLQLGNAASGAPAAHILTIGEYSIPGTSNNIGGANGTLQSGLGTGTGAASTLIFQTPALAVSGTGTQTQTTRLTLGLSAVFGSAAIATNATDGFIYIATCAGTPTGTPTAQTGRVAMVYDTTNHQFWIYDGGWLQPKTPAAAAIVNWQ